MRFPFSQIPAVETLFGVAGKVAIVTGGAHGIGRATAGLLALSGARVAIADRDFAGAQRVVEELREVSGGKAQALAVDVDIADEESVLSLFSAAESEFSTLDILVNNAAIIPITPMFDIDVDSWDRVQGVNLRGTFLCMREGIRRMKQAGKGGSIINISSVGSFQTATHGGAAYAASKGGINSLTKLTALEFASDNIRINGVVPGAFDSLGDRQFPYASMPTGPIMEAGRIPLGRAGTPLELASVVMFLASPAAAYITGQLLVVDGGFLIS